MFLQSLIICLFRATYSDYHVYSNVKLKGVTDPTDVGYVYAGV